MPCPTVEQRRSRSPSNTKRAEPPHVASPTRPAPDPLAAIATCEAPRNRTDRPLWGEMAPLPAFSQSARLPAVCSGDGGSRERRMGERRRRIWGATRGALLDDVGASPAQTCRYLVDIINSIYSKWVTFGIRVS